MHRNFEKFSKIQYDLLVIGGGINGAGIAYLAQEHGLKTALLEKKDFASGTSGASTKLIHGGIRYLENLDFRLVMESLKERAIQLKAAPHLVKPISFIIPVYKGDKRPLWLMRLGVFVYDFLAGTNSIEKHSYLSADKILKLIPGIRREGLLGGMLYYDAQMDDSRLCLENILSASEKGADIANYVEVISFLKEGGKVVGTVAKDNLGGSLFEIRARKVVCAVGPWTNYLLRKDNPHAEKIIRTTKGVHIVFEEKFSDHAILLSSNKDGRVFFVIPWMGHSLIGTTDTNYIKNPDTIDVLQKDIQYLVKNAERIFPDKDFSSRNIIASFAGLRPLVRKGGDPSKVTRNHAIVKTPSGLTFVTGGKYTTYRKIAQDALWKTFKIRTKNPFRLYGGGHIRASVDNEAKKHGMDPDTIAWLMSKYGTRYQGILSLIEKDKRLSQRICDCSPVIEAQVVYSIRNEMALTEDDIISRRLSLQFSLCRTKKCRSLIREYISNSVSIK